MDRQLLHTPEGVRDIYAEECARKLAVQKKIQNVFRLYGYQDIETPVFEFFDIFKKERGSAGTAPGHYPFHCPMCGKIFQRRDRTFAVVLPWVCLFEYGQLPGQTP